MQVGKSGLIKKTGAKDRSVIDLSCPRPPRVSACDAWCVRTANGVLRGVVEKSIDVHSKHQVLVRCELVVQPTVEEELTVVTCVIETSIPRQHEGRQRV